MGLKKMAGRSEHYLAQPRWLVITPEFGQLVQFVQMRPRGDLVPGHVPQLRQLLRGSAGE
jgi:hypothetical protein